MTNSTKAIPSMNAWWGAALPTGALALLVVLVQRSQEVSWTSPVTIGMAVGSAVLFAAFVVVEFRIPAPLISPA